MNKKILQIVSFLVLAILFTAASASAQITRKYSAEIPFDFQIGNEKYEAGDYKINLTDPWGGAMIFTLNDSEGNKLQRNAVRTNGNISEQRDKTSLVFNRYGDEYVLREFVSPRFSFNAPKPKGKVKVDYLGKPDHVSIVLRR